MGARKKQNKSTSSSNIGTNHTTYGVFVRKYREKKGLTQRNLSEAIGVDRATISRIEAGTSDISVMRLISIAEALGVTAGMLLGESGTLMIDEENLIQDYRSADSRGQRMISLIARAEREREERK